MRLIQIGARLGYPIDATQFNAAMTRQLESKVSALLTKAYNDVTDDFHIEGSKCINA